MSIVALHNLVAWLEQYHRLAETFRDFRRAPSSQESVAHDDDHPMDRTQDACVVRCDPQLVVAQGGVSLGACRQ